MVADLASLVINSGFETGTLYNSNLSVGWSHTGTAIVVGGAGVGGTYGAKISPSGSITQTVNGLQPNTTYRISAYGKVDAGVYEYFTVQDYGGAAYTYDFSSTTYVSQAFDFTTGPNSTSAQIVFSRGAAAGYGYVDNVLLRDLGPVANWGFEIPDPTVGWTPTGSVAVVGSGEAHSGDYAVQLASGATLDHLFAGLLPTTTYTVSVFGKVDAGSAALSVTPAGGAAQPLVFTSGAYSEQEATFTTPAGSLGSVDLDFTSSTGAGYGYFDDVSISQAYTYVPTNANVTISESSGVLSIVDGSGTTEIPVGTPRQLTIAPTSSETVTVDQSGGNLTFPDLLTVQGSSAITLQISGGSYTFRADAGAQASDLTVQASGGTSVTFTTGQTLVGLTIDSGADASFAPASTLAFSAPISGGGNLSKTGSATLTLSGTNAYTGGTTVSGGTLKAGSSSALGAGALTVTSGATLDLNGYNLTVDALNGAGTIVNNATSTNKALTVGSNDADGSFSGLISAGNGTLALVKTGTGVLTLSGANTYSGGTTLSNGTLLVTNTTGSATGTANVTLNVGTLGGSGIITGTVVGGSGAHTIAPSATLSSGTATTLTLGGLTTNANTTLAFNLISPESGSDESDLIVITGTLTFTTGTTPILSITGNSTGVPSLGYYKVIEYGSISNLPGGAPPLTSPPVVNEIAYVAYSTQDVGYIDVHRGFEGDANDDGTVDFSDFATVSNNLGLCDTGWQGGDFDGNRITNSADFTILSNNFGNTLNESGMGMVTMGAGATLTDEQFGEMLAFVQRISPTLSSEDLAQLPSLVQRLATFTPDNGASVALYTDGTYLDVTQTTLLAGAPG